MRRRKSRRLILQTRLASPIFVFALAIPMVRMNKPIRSFGSAKTCSTRERIFDLALLARRISSGIGPPFEPLPMDMADEAVPFHELLVGGRSVSGVRPEAARRVGLVEKSIAQTADDTCGIIARFDSLKAMSQLMTMPLHRA